MDAIQRPRVPRIYKNPQTGEFESVKPYFPANHPNTIWIINRVRAGDATPLVNLLKTRESMNLFFKYMYFQIVDNPCLYCPSEALDQPMFNRKAYLFLNLFSVALYFRRETLVRVLAQNKVAKDDGSGSYESISEVSMPQYAAFVRDYSMGDLMKFPITVIMMRRETYFAVSELMKHGNWAPKGSMTVEYYRRNYHFIKQYDDWLEYAWKLLDERPYTKISHLVTMLSRATNQKFYLNDKIHYEPIPCICTKIHDSSSQAERYVIVYRSYPRRILCKLFLHRDPLRILPQIIPFIRVFQRERFFISLTSKALNPSFRKRILANLEERFISLSPICNIEDANSSAYVEKYSHKASIYDYDNILALLLHFTVITADRNVKKLKNSIIELVMDILKDMTLVYVYAKEPAVNISYYLSYLVDGPFIQPNSLQHMLKNIPSLLLNIKDPKTFFPPYLQTLEEDQEADDLFLVELPRLWKQNSFVEALRLMMKYRIEIDAEEAQFITHCSWKNEKLITRLTTSLGTRQQTQPVQTKKNSECLCADDPGFVGRLYVWKARPESFFDRAKDFMLRTVADTKKQRIEEERGTVLLKWTLEDLGLSDLEDKPTRKSDSPLVKLKNVFRGVSAV